jgi:hypothetical protein
MYRILHIVLMMSVLSACSSRDGLMVVDSGDGPDEFSVLPALPLQAPASLSLPQPTPGGANLSDPDPLGDAIRALRGNPAAASAGGIPARDAALVAHVSRNGVDPDIRATLAEADAAYRDRARIARSLNILGQDQYFPAYRRWALDAYAELERFRALGVEVPSAPPR